MTSHHISREISSEATVRGEGGITGEGRLVGNQSFIPGISVPQKLTPLACVLHYIIPGFFNLYLGV